MVRAQKGLYLALLLVFEFITLLVHPCIEHLTEDAPAIMLLILLTIAAFLFPFHHKLEKWAKERVANRVDPPAARIGKLTAFKK